MGQFSWLDCKTGEQILDNVCRDSYLLIPKEFGGGHIIEHCYDGYGCFGGKDVFDLVATWNREWAAENPDFVLRGHKESLTLRNQEFYPFYADLSMPEGDVIEKWRDVTPSKYIFLEEWRQIGITLACYDEDNERLRFPIKITHDPDSVYEECGPSQSDPNQGWLMEDENDNEDFW